MSIGRTFLVVFAALLVGGCGTSDPVVNDSAPEHAATVEVSGSSLDDAGKNACYLFFKWAEDATILNDEEMHSRVKEIWDGGSGFLGTTGAKDSSNAVIMNGARGMLEAEVAGDYTALAAAGTRVGDECKRLAP